MRAFWREAGGELEHDNLFLPLDVLARAPFPVYVVRQREGDCTMVGPDTVHEVYNCGDISVKLAWNVLPTRSLEVINKKLTNKIF